MFDLDTWDLEYAFSIDGPYDPKKGLIFDKTKYLLDIYAKAVTGQGTWGSKPESGFRYKARVVSDNFNWDDCCHPPIPMLAGSLSAGHTGIQFLRQLPDVP